MKKVTLFLNKATYLVMLLIASLTMFTGCSDDDKTSSRKTFHHQMKKPISTAL